MSVLEVSRISKIFGEFPVINDVSLNLHSGEVTALVGGNGSGKSTLMKMISGLIQPSSGKIQMQGVSMSFRRPADALRRGIGMVYQDDPICPDLSVTENVLLGQEAAFGKMGLFQFVSHAQSKEKASYALKRVGLSQVRLDQKAKELSGGERKILMIARTLSAQPKILILDEPTNSLGVKEQKRILDLVLKLKEDGLSIVYVSHKITEVRAIADRILAMERGRVALDCRTDSIDDEKLNRYMAGDENG